MHAQLLTQHAHAHARARRVGPAAARLFAHFANPANAANYHASCTGRLVVAARCGGSASLPARGHVRVRGAAREPKDPSRFRSMDEMREYLEVREDRSQVTISNLLSFISEASMGSGPIGSRVGLPGAADDSSSSSSRSSTDGGSGGGGGGGSSGGRSEGGATSADATQPWQVLGATLRGVLVRGAAKAYRDFVWRVGAAVRHRRTGGTAADDEAKWPQVDPDKYKQLEALLGGAFMSLRGLRKAAFKYPPLLKMDAAELAMRLVGLKQVMAGCDVALLVEQEPQLYLGGRREEVEGALSTSMALLQRGLAGADVAQVVMRDPRLPFMRELPHGLQQLRDLWDVDEAAMEASDPQMLALAVRALSVSGLPEGM